MTPQSLSPKLIAIGAIILIVIVGGGIFVSKYMQRAQTPPPVIETTPPPVVETTNTYASTTAHFSVTYPKDFILDEAYSYDQFGPKKLIHGVKFHIPESMATGTNLSAADTGIAIESLPRAKSCTGDIYINANVKATKLSDTDIDYSVATTTGAAAGNLYEEQIFAVSSSSPCIAFRYFIHSSNIGNYPLGVVREFDHAALLKAFDDIRHSLVFTQ